jgi:Tol biopolymer transport system component
VLFALVILPAAAGSSSATGIEKPRGKIVYTASSGDLWTMNADGSRRRRVTRSGPAADYSPSWAPDGRRIVFRTERGRYVRDPHGSGAEGIFVINADGLHERQIQPRTGGLFPSWAPNGKKIAYTGLKPGGDGIFLMNPDGTKKQDLHTKSVAAEGAVWSPDSTKISYGAHDGDGNWAVWIMNADGSGQRQLTHPVLVQPAGTGGDSPTSFSPDGQRILFSSGQHQTREIYAIDVDGGGRRRLTNWLGADSPKAWLPDGRIVFGHYTGDAARPRWFVMNSDGSGITPIPALNRVRAGDPISWLPRSQQAGRPSSR